MTCRFEMNRRTVTVKLRQFRSREGNIWSTVIRNVINRTDYLAV